MLISYTQCKNGTKYMHICKNNTTSVYCNSETWLSLPGDLSTYSVKDEIVFGNRHPDKGGDGVMMLVKPTLCPVLCFHFCAVLPSNGCNICFIQLRTAQC